MCVSSYELIFLGNKAELQVTLISKLANGIHKTLVSDGPFDQRWVGYNNIISVQGIVNTVSTVIIVRYNFLTSFNAYRFVIIHSYTYINILLLRK